MKFDGPTVGLLADDTFGAFSDLANIPMSAARLANRGQLMPSLPSMPPQMRNGGYSTPALSLGLHQPSGPEMQPEVIKGENDLRGTKNKRHEEEIDSRSGSGSENLGNASGGEQGPPPKKKRYHRHTARQIQEMEAFFKECPHPDDKQRQELSLSLGLEPRQVKFWFQNRRTQLKAQQERAENSVLRVERDKLMAENITLTQALRSSYCPRCEGPTSVREVSFDEHNLRLENAYLKEELERLSHVAMKFFGRNQNFSQQAPQFSASSLNLSVGGNPSSPPPSSGLYQPPLALEDSKPPASDSEKSRMLSAAVTAMEELIQLTQENHPVWYPSPNGPKEIFNEDEYRSHFPKSAENSQCSFNTDASHASGIAMMSAAGIVETLMDATKYMSFFPTMVSKALTMEVCNSVNGTLDGTLQLMCAEFQVMSPLIQAREVYFLRFSKQTGEGAWCVVDFPADGFRNTPPPSTFSCRRCPSGFVIREDPEGFTKVTVLEHMEYDPKFLPETFRSFVSSGAAFGAHKWIATLQRQSEALHFVHSTVSSPRDVGALPLAGRQSLLKLAQKMTSGLCQGVGATGSHSWTTLQSGCGVDDSVRVMTRKTTDNTGEPHGIILSAATTIWLQASPQQVYDYIRLEHVRNEWAMNCGIADEVVRIAKSEGDGNAVSLFQINNNPLMLQESLTDASGSIVAYAPVDVPSLNLLMQGGDPSQISVLPSGFAILPDGAEDSSSVEPRASGTLLTVSVQILLAPPSAKLPIDSVVAINSLINSTVQKVQAALSQNNQL